MEKKLVGFLGGFALVENINQGIFISTPSTYLRARLYIAEWLCRSNWQAQGVKLYLLSHI